METPRQAHRGTSTHIHTCKHTLEYRGELTKRYGHRHPQRCRHTDVQARKTYTVSQRQTKPRTKAHRN